MATRSAIIMKTRNGKFKGIYCHSDGYFSWNGRILYENYKDKNKVKKLINLGYISSLNEEVDIPEGVHHEFEYENRAPGITVAYVRDRGDKKSDNKPIVDTLKNILDILSWCQYGYVFINNEWYTIYDNLEYHEEFDKSNIDEIITVESIRLIKLSYIESLLKI